MLNVDVLLKDYFQNVDENIDKPLIKVASSVLKKLFHQDEINSFIETHQYLEGLEFNDAVLELSPEVAQAPALLHFFFTY